jgi:hypothetical protein
VVTPSPYRRAFACLPNPPIPKKIAKVGIKRKNLPSSRFCEREGARTLNQWLFFTLAFFDDYRLFLKYQAELLGSIKLYLGSHPQSDVNCDNTIKVVFLFNLKTLGWGVE